MLISWSRKWWCEATRMGLKLRFKRHTALGGREELHILDVIDDAQSDPQRPTDVRTVDIWGFSSPASSAPAEEWQLAQQALSWWGRNQGTCQHPVWAWAIHLVGRRVKNNWRSYETWHPEDIFHWALLLPKSLRLPWSWPILRPPSSVLLSRLEAALHPPASSIFS